MSTEQESYRLVTADYGAELEGEVNALIREGYEPLGGVSISVMQIDVGTAIVKYAQAMYRRPPVAYTMKLSGDASAIAEQVAALTESSPPRHA
jgi:hypothetical protein